ncbi:hypothetical protein [Maribacter thermophilus]|uniref:hypothetical protein n=1 Tax=Maribacter thermophilus TaxID=1197874 RepID=UPI0006414C72|nr:hypothetical protein [Maribacter thermophilus]
MKRFYLGILILFVSCKNTIDKKGIFDESEYSKHNIEYLQASIFLPKDYIEVDKSKLEEFLFKPLQKEVPSNVINMWKSNLQSLNSGISIYKKVSDPLNFIVIKKYPNYIPITMGTSKFIKNLMEDYLRSDAKNYDLRYELKESVLLSRPNIEIYKFKYWTNISGIKSDNIRYFIDFNKQTFEAQVLNVKNEDFDKIFKNIERENE